MTNTVWLKVAWLALKVPVRTSPYCTVTVLVSINPLKTFECVNLTVLTPVWKVKNVPGPSTGRQSENNSKNFMKKNGFDRWFEKETTFRIFSVKNPWEPNSGTNFALAPCIVLTVFRKKFKMSKKYLWKSWRVLPRWWSRIYSVHRFLIKGKLNRLFSLWKHFVVWRFKLRTSR